MNALRRSRGSATLSRRHAHTPTRRYVSLTVRRRSPGSTLLCKTLRLITAIIPLRPLLLAIPADPVESSDPAARDDPVLRSQRVFPFQLGRVRPRLPEFPD